MKNLALAGGIVAFGAGLLFVVMTWIGMEKAGALQLATAPLFGIKYVHEVLEKNKPSALARPKGVVSFQGFALPWYQMLVYGTLIFAATKQFGGLIAGFTAGLAAVSPEALLIITVVVANLVAIIGVHAICFWIGTRCDKYMYLVAVAIPLFGHVIGGLIDFLALSDAEFINFFGVPKGAGFFLEGVIVGTLIVLPFALAGAWRGQRARLPAYLSYLLRSLPPDTRDTIINLTYEEVKALASGQVNSPQARAEPVKP